MSLLIAPPPQVTTFRPVQASDFRGLVYWLRADRGVTLVAGSKVSVWADLARAIASVDASQGTDAQRFVWAADAGNGKPGVGAPAAANATMSTPGTSIVGAQPNTILAVYRTPASFTRTNVFFDGISARQSWQIPDATHSLDYAGTVQSTAVSSLTSRTIVHSSLFNGASSTFRINGAQYATVDAGSGTLANGLRLGNAAGSFAVEGYMQELIIYNRLLAAGGELTLLEKALSAYYATGF